MNVRLCSIPTCSPLQAGQSRSTQRYSNLPCHCLLLQSLTGGAEPFNLQDVAVQLPDQVLQSPTGGAEPFNGAKGTPGIPAGPILQSPTSGEEPFNGGHSHTPSDPRALQSPTGGAEPFDIEGNA